MTAAYSYALGERLRTVRRQQGLSLRQVEDKSAGRHKAVVVGSYERADRALGVVRLGELAAFYGVPVAALLPPPEGRAVTRPSGVHRLVLDLDVLDACPPESPFGPVRAFAGAVRGWRGDWAGKVLSVRSGDEPLLALLCGVDQAELVERLVVHGLAVTGPRFDGLVALKSPVPEQPAGRGLPAVTAC